MLPNQTPSCHRRGFLETVAGLGLSFALPAMDLRAATRRGDERPKSLVTLWLGGGPSQLETWDPHPGKSVGGPTRALKTSIPGVEIAEYFPALAEQLRHVSVIPLVGFERRGPRSGYLFCEDGVSARCYGPAPGGRGDCGSRPAQSETGNSPRDLTRPRESTATGWFSGRAVRRPAGV